MSGDTTATDGVAPADVHRWRLTLDVTAVDHDTLVTALTDVATNLLHRDLPSHSVFASPSCSGVVTLADRQTPA